jgi:hypothetical protein
LLKTVRKTFLTLTVVALSAQATLAQDPTGAQATSSSLPATINVYLDCGFCDFDHLRTEIAFVNWVTDPSDADVHLLATSQSTGGGGSEYTFNFLGRRAFSRLVDTLKTVVTVDMTADNRRAAYTRTIKTGLVPFLAKTAIATRLNISVPGQAGAAAQQQQRDPWHKWVFRLSASGYTNGDRNYKYLNAYYSGSATRVTQLWKTAIGGNYSYDDQKTFVENGNTAGDADTTFVTIKRNWNSYASQFRGFNEHWSLGMTGSLGSNTYQNQSKYARAKAAIEYNLFPYKESTRRQLRAQYGAGAQYYKYIDTTIYLKTQETEPFHYAAVAIAAKQPWGEIDANLSRTALLRHPSFSSTILYGYTEVRIVKGLRFFISGEYDWIHDQLYLRKGSASTSSVLLRQQALASSYFYYANVGLSYNFGSILNNIVFPRFGGNSTF